MTDLHCHILPAIDDGAKNAKVSMELLRMQNDAGITDIVCTPHFNPDSQNLEDFIDKRYRSARYLADYVFRSELPVRLKFGAEVRISPTILDLDFLPLCFQKTKVMLLEMPRTLRPQWDTNVIYQLTLGGVIPLIAHIERYPYVQKNPNIALDWIEAGAYLQVNADSIVGDTMQRNFVYRLIKHGVVNVIASDTHSPDKRPPQLTKAMRLITRKFDNAVCRKLECNAQSLFNGDAPDVEQPVPISKWF